MLLETLNSFLTRLLNRKESPQTAQAVWKTIKKSGPVVRHGQPKAHSNARSNANPNNALDHYHNPPYEG